MTAREESDRAPNPVPNSTAACRFPRLASPGPHRALVVLNPVAGTSQAEQVRQEISAVFATYDWQCCFYETTGADDFAALIDKTIHEGGDVVIAAGGDGTVADVASALVGKNVPLGIIPVGTGNVLSLELGIPQTVTEAATLLVSEHETCQLDAMRINGHYYFLQVGVGLDSLMIRDTTRSSKRRFGRLAYTFTLLRKLVGYRAKSMALRIDGQEHRRRAWDVVVANVGTLGFPAFHWNPDINPTDGTLDLIVLTVNSPLDIVRLLWRLSLGLPENGSPLSVFPVERDVTIATWPPQPVQADGEIVGTTSVTVSVVPNAIRVIVSEECPVLDEGRRERTRESQAHAHRFQQLLRQCLGPIGVIDTAAALLVSALPHPPILNLLMQGLAQFMNRGDGWIIWLVGRTMSDPRRGLAVLGDVTPALWLTDLTVEGVIKPFFRRDRPFRAQVLAEVIGQKPSGHSFPSGHTAAAFAGAWLLSHHFPRRAPIFYALASLVGFCRLYLGVHYLSDVLAGAASGITFAAIYWWLVRTIFHTRVR
ncbi:MAG TPA: diacylglycerol kinase family protein [Chloroflexota bacterium]|nr:diacylglycerol kinase family protein [Chloroflexota bacterium]